MTRGKLSAIIIGVAITAHCTGFFIGKINGLTDGYQRGREMENRQIRASLRDGIESGYTFFLPDMDIRFKPTRDGSLVASVSARYFSRCERCHDYKIR